MCGADRTVSRGYCGASEEIEISKIMLHHWEEPCISGSGPSRGSGAVFFTHCPLGCVYCQNGRISKRDSSGKEYSPVELADALLALQNDGAYNINFVSPTQYTAQLIKTVQIAREKGLTLPIVWNTGGYELPSIIEELRGTVDIFLTDFKYADPKLSASYSSANDYPAVAEASLAAMYKTVGEFVISDEGIMERGVIVRHLILPSHRNDSIAVLRKIATTVPPDKIKLSLMAQYTHEFLPKPNGEHDRFSKIRRRITTFEYESVLKEANLLGFDGFAQDRSSAVQKYTPDF